MSIKIQQIRIVIVTVLYNLFLLYEGCLFPFICVVGIGDTQGEGSQERGSGQNQDRRCQISTDPIFV